VKLMEWQSKKLLAGFGIPLSESVVIASAMEAAAVAEAIGGRVVLKAQLPFGGRGKLGAVRLIDSPDEVRDAAEALFALRPRGACVRWLSVEPRLDIAQEIYIGVTWDARAKRPVALLNSAGGVNVESASPGTLSRRTFDPDSPLPAYVGREMAAEVGFTGRILVTVGQCLSRLAEAFIALDATLVEINPLVVTGDDRVIGVDARVELDDDADYRQSARWAAAGNLEAGDSGRAPTDLELEAKRIDAMDHRGVAGRVVEFDGNLALLIGGGGGSLTVFDAVLRYGGKPANYCEVGGNPTEEKVAALVALLLSKPGVQKLAVIMNVVNNTRADVMARGVLMGIERAGRDPAETICVFRIPGSWEDEARELLASAGVTALGRDISLNEAARLAVERMAAHVA
jgi:succinyl-CoA synthetase beta subunit/citryl-CoA synthetase large subunit